MQGRRVVTKCKLKMQKKTNPFNKKHKHKELLQNTNSKCKDSDTLKRKMIGEALNPNNKNNKNLKLGPI